VPDAHHLCDCDECVAKVMETLQIGIQEGLSIAEARLACNFERKPLTWRDVQARLERDDG
jgi:hypothetical protein